MGPKQLGSKFLKRSQICSHTPSALNAGAKRSGATCHYGHASMLLLGEGSEATEPYNKYDKIRPHSIRSQQFDQKVRPLSFRPEKFDLFTATQNVEVPLLAFSPLIDETSQSAAQQYVFLEMTLSQYGKSMEDNVVALIADNCETNKALADICNVPLVGCHSHRLALAVKEYLTNKDELIQKVNTLMGKSKAPKTAAESRILIGTRNISIRIVPLPKTIRLKTLLLSYSLVMNVLST